MLEISLFFDKWNVNLHRFRKSLTVAFLCSSGHWGSLLLGFKTFPNRGFNLNSSWSCIIFQNPFFSDRFLGQSFLYFNCDSFCLIWTVFVVLVCLLQQQRTICQYCCFGLLSHVFLVLWFPFSLFAQWRVRERDFMPWDQNFRSRYRDVWDREVQDREIEIA